MNQEAFSVAGQIIDIVNKEIFPGEVEVKDGIILSVKRLDSAPGQYILPGFVDAHIHIESSLLVPSEFARLAVPFGTVATVSDPHEIGNVLGIDGVRYMIEDGEKVMFKFNFGAPSCVPATHFETAGAEIDVAGVQELLADERIKYLAEMMNWPGVLHDDPVVLAKIKAAAELGKPVDGHAPGLRGEDAKNYIARGISTDHECFTKEEALDKLKHDMKILIREGSAARNFDALHQLLHDHSDQMMFCSDDMHPDLLVTGHINRLVARAIKAGIDLFKVLQAACINPVNHYKLDVGLLREGDPADFIIVENLEAFDVIKTYIDGELVADHGKSLIPAISSSIVNKFNTKIKTAEDFQVRAGARRINIIEALDGELITNCLQDDALVENGFAVSHVEKDILKLAVVNRYDDQPPAIAFIRNFGLKEGAIASSVGHDSHNITVVGVDDESIMRAVNLIIESKGGLSLVSKEQEMVLPLPVAGLMSNEDGYGIAEKYAQIDAASKALGSELRAPFMTLSFMALLVIPSIKLSDKGLFDGDKFQFMDLFIKK
jgi:adenine deaminase